MIRTITEESDFYFWLVEYLHQRGPKKTYPKALADAADLALELIAECQHESEALDELVPGAVICPCCGDKRNQALGLVFHLAREVELVRPYSEAVIHFLADCYRPPASTVFEDAARLAFRVAGFHRSEHFSEVRKGRSFYLSTTKLGRAELGVSVRLSYEVRYGSYVNRKPRTPRPGPKPKKLKLRVLSSV